MDEAVCWPTASCTSPSPASFSTAGGPCDPEPDFVFSEALEQWVRSDDCATWADEGSRSVGHDDDQSGPGSGPGPGTGQPQAPPAPPKRRGRKPGPRTNGPVISHVEAERQRRDKLNRRFCELRAAVPTVSRMDKASLLADAAAYIAELRNRAEQLEAEAKRRAATAMTTAYDAAAAAAVTRSTLLAAAAGTHSLTSFGGFQEKLELEVRMVGQEAAALRLTTTTTPAASRAHAHAPARFMLALRSLDLPVQHACVCRVDGVTVQDAVVDVPAAALRSERSLHVALLHRLQRVSG